MWIFLTLILFITAGTVLTLDQRSDKVYHKWEPTHKVLWTTSCWPWHYTDQHTNMLVLIIFSCMKWNKVQNVWFECFVFSQRFQTNFQTNSERNQEPGLELQDGCTHRFYQKAPLLLLITSYTSTHLSKVAPSCSHAETSTSLVLKRVTFAFIWVCRRFKLKRESLKKQGVGL